jgi:hypothetical protein
LGRKAHIQALQGKPKTGYIASFSSTITAENVIEDIRKYTNISIVFSKKDPFSTQQSSLSKPNGVVKKKPSQHLSSSDNSDTKTTKSAIPKPFEDNSETDLNTLILKRDSQSSRREAIQVKIKELEAAMEKHSTTPNNQLVVELKMKMNSYNQLTSELERTKSQIEALQKSPSTPPSTLTNGILDSAAATKSTAPKRIRSSPSIKSLISNHIVGQAALVSRPLGKADPVVYRESSKSPSTTPSQASYTATQKPKEWPCIFIKYVPPGTHLWKLFGAEPGFLQYLIESDGSRLALFELDKHAENAGSYT